MNIATSGSAYSVLALSLPMPRMVRVTTPWSPCEVASKPGTSLVMSCTVITRSLSSESALIALIATGVFCSGVSRLVAVTWTLSRSFTFLLAAVSCGAGSCAAA